MGTITNLTQRQVENIQIDEGVVYLNFQEENETLIAPTRGGGEFTATTTVRDIEFDGRNGKTDLQVIEEQGATLKVTFLDMSQDKIALLIPNCAVEGTEDNAVLKNPKSGLIPSSSYLKNITMFTKLLSGKYKRITIYNAMHETGFTAKAVQKAEGEFAAEFNAHYKTSDLDGKLWEISVVDTIQPGE